MERKTENKVDMSREEGQLLRRMLDVPVAGKRWRGRQKTRWKDSCKRDMHGKYVVKSGGNHKPFWRPQMMEKVRGCTGDAH